MALTDESGNGMVMPVAPMGNMGGFGGDWGSWIILFLIFGMFGNGWGGYGGNNALSYDFPWLMNGQQGINANTNAGFRDAMLNDGITAINNGIHGLSTQLCNCCGDMQMALSNGFAGVEQAANTRQIANMQTAFNQQTAINQGFSDLRYSVASENCADRQAVSDGVRDILTATQAQTTAILNQLCADKIEAKNDTIAQLRSELLYARGQASQDVQTAAIQAGQRTLANEIEAYVAPKAIPAYVVQNPNCCPQYCGCSV